MFHKTYLAGLSFIALVVMVVSQGAIFIGNKKHPTKDDYCYDDENNLEIQINQTLYPTNIQWKCFKVFCRQDYVLRFNYCPRRAMPCQRLDFSKPYPECCKCI